MDSFKDLERRKNIARILPTNVPINGFASKAAGLCVLCKRGEALHHIPVMMKLSCLDLQPERRKRYHNPGRKVVGLMVGQKEIELESFEDS